MISVLKLIFRKIPKLFRWMIGTIFIAPILVYIVVQYATNKPIELFQNNLVYLSLFIIALVIAAFVIASFRSIKDLLNEKNTIKPISSTLSISEKKILPYSEITIGTFKTEDLCADIRSELILEEPNKPSIDIFLDRVRNGEPFCPSCSRPMDYWRASWMANGAQIGYQCLNCKIQHKGDYDDVLKDIKGEVRKNFNKYWETYKTEFEKLVQGNPTNYQLPK